MGDAGLPAKRAAGYQGNSAVCPNRQLLHGTDRRSHQSERAVRNSAAPFGPSPPTDLPPCAQKQIALQGEGLPGVMRLLEYQTLTGQNVETLLQVRSLRCSENTPRRSITDSRGVERNPASWIDRPSIAAKCACRRQSAEHEDSRFQAGIAALIQAAVFPFVDLLWSASSPSPRFQPKVSVSLTTFEVLTQPPKTC